MIYNIKVLDYVFLVEFYDDKVVKVQRGDEKNFFKNPLPYVVENFQKELENYFLGNITKLKTNFILHATPFQKKVYNELLNVRVGEIISYKELAKKCCGENYTRQVARALAKNPLPIIFPCHRVVRANFKLGEYNLGCDIKKTMLEIEGSYIKIKKDK